jgi:hypothetical protein
MGGIGFDGGLNNFTYKTIFTGNVFQNGRGGPGMNGIPGGAAWMPSSLSVSNTTGSVVGVAQNGWGNYPGGNIFLANGSGGGSASLSGTAANSSCDVSIRAGNGGPGAGGGGAYLTCTTSGSTTAVYAGNGGIFGGGGGAITSPASSGSTTLQAGAGGYGAGGGGAAFTNTVNFLFAGPGTGGQGVIFMEW